MQNVLLEEEVFGYFLAYLGSGAVLRYKLQMSKQMQEEALADITAKFDFELTSFLTFFMETVLVLIDDNGNLIQEGNQLFEYLGELSRRLEDAHPDF